MKILRFLTLVTVTLLFLCSCSKQKDSQSKAMIENDRKTIELSTLSESKEFISIENLAKFFISSLNNQDDKAVIKAYFSKDKYIQEVYPYTSEGQSPNALSAEEFFNTFILRQRINAAQVLVDRFKGTKLVYIKTGKPVKSFRVGEYTFHKYIPVTVTEIDRKTKKKTTITYPRFIGIVLEKDSKFYLFNLFK